ncbi:uncharacterized protein [Nicotiana tomentosiformis]|uniref:uncharacterized protein n=1 Tax=Nicotiana tomentosiformis TaxID=4098 RepID=UPI00388CA347
MTMGSARGRGRGRAQPRGRATAPVVEPQVDFEAEVPAQTVPVGPLQVLEGFIATPVLQNALVRLASDRPAMSSETLLRLDKFTKFFPVHFSGTPTEDPQDYLDRCYEVLQNMGIVESSGVNFIVFQMTGSAKRWWRDYIFTRPADSPAFPASSSHRQFEHLQQVSMTVTQYETRFVDLACHVIVLLPTEKERVGRFIDGLTYTIRLQMAKEIGSDISFQTPVNIARQIKLVHAQERGLVSDKRPRHYGNFRGVSPGGRSTYGRDHPPRPFYLALQASHGASGSHSPIVPYSWKPAFSTHSALISALPLQIHYSGSTYSYVSSYFNSYLVVPRDSLSASECVSTPIGDSISVDHAYRSCVVTIGSLETSIDLLLLDMVDFDIILGMDWLSPYHAILDCHAKTVTLSMPVLPRIEWKGTLGHSTNKVISYVKDRRMVEKRCLAYLAYIRDPSVDVPSVDSVPVVRKFPNIFPVDFLGMPPDRDIDFYIDLSPGTQPISILSYRMASPVLEELKE